MQLRILTVLLAFLGAGHATAQQPPRILVFGDSNSWGWTAQASGFPTARLDAGLPWPDVMANRLGTGFVVSVDALSGRTTNVDYAEPVGTVPGNGFNGARALPAAIAREMPVALVLIMLGTNDVRSDLDRTPAQIAAGLRTLVETVRNAAGGVLTSYPAPRVLVVVPPHIQDTSRTPIGGIMAGAQEKSRALAEAARAALSGVDVPVFDAASVVTISGIDGVHMTPADHQALGEAMAAEIRRVLPTP